MTRRLIRLLVTLAHVLTSVMPRIATMPPPARCGMSSGTWERTGPTAT
jgi:hypothetical protein